MNFFDEDLEDFLGNYLDDDLEVLDLVEFGFPRKVYDRSNYFQTLAPLAFYKHFRLYIETALSVLTEIEEELEYTSDRNNSVAPMDQLLTALRYYASAGHLLQVADFMNMDVSTASRIVSKVSMIIARMFPRYVCMPGRQDIVREQNNFYNIARFPRVIGVVDGTHIKIHSPGNVNAELYRNRKGYFSLNVQVVANSQFKFMDVVERWPGSTHDATIFGHRNLRARFEAGEFPNSVLLGDSGYPLKDYLLTPLQEPVTRAENLYQEALVRTRNLIERTIGIWKRRFPIVAYGSRLKLDTTKTIVIATTVLHNIARQMNEPEELPHPDNIDMGELNYLIETQDIEMPAVRNPLNRVNIVQREIVNFFQGLVR